MTTICAILFLLTLAATPEPKVGEQTDALKREAISAAQQVSQEYPDDAASQLLLAAAYYNQGDSRRAERHLAECLELNPQQAEAWDMLAMVYWQKGLAERCAELCLEALKISPKNVGTYHRLGQVLLDLGQPDEAMRWLRQAIRIQSRSSQSHYLLAQAHLQAGQLNEAKQSFHKAVRLTRREPTILRNDSSNENHWLRIRLKGTRTNRGGIGARVTVVSGQLRQIAEVHSGRSYQSDFGKRLHFGLGKRQTVDHVEVRWLGGHAEIFSDVQVDGLATLVEGAGQPR